MNTMSPLVRSFVAHFGEMGSRWGINRTVGQIYALIFVSPRPLNADEMAEALEFSRSNVSMGLKELQAWRLVRLKHLPGDRREYFEAPGDAWEIFRTLAEERRRREVEPTPQHPTALASRRSHSARSASCSRPSRPPCSETPGSSGGGMRPKSHGMNGNAARPAHRRVPSGYRGGTAIPNWVCARHRRHPNPSRQCPRAASCHRAGMRA